MRPLPSALIVLLASILPASAASLSAFPLAVVSGQFAGDTRPIDGLPITAIYAGDTQIFLDQTRLDEITAALGGQVHGGGAGGEAAWACYALADGAALWAYSDGKAGEGRVSMMALEAGTPALESGCVGIAVRSGEVDFAVPSLGAPARDLASQFGPFEIDAQGRVGFHGEQPAWGEDELPTAQWLVYRLGGGRVVAVGVAQATGP